MRKYYDFSNAKKNPHNEMLKNGYTIIVEHNDFNETITVKKTRQQKSNNKIEESSSKSLPIASQ